MQHFDSFAEMQRDAERRVMEMQKRAMAAVENIEPPPHGEPLPPSVKKDEPQDCRRTPPNEHPPQNLFSSLGLSGEDSERALLIVIIILLMREDADHRLILALLYILM